MTSQVVQLVMVAGGIVIILLSVVEYRSIRTGTTRQSVLHPQRGRLKPALTYFVVVCGIFVALAVSIYAGIASVIIWLVIIVVLIYVARPAISGRLKRRQRKQVIWRSTVHTTPQQTVSVTIADVSIEDFLDPVTGIGFNQTEEIWQCTNCSSLYHAESRNFIAEQNTNRCVVCKSQNQISGYRPGQAITRPVTYEVARRFRPEIITIDDAARNVGRIVSFEGRVVEVQRSQTSETYAVKFRRGRWVDVFKLVIFPQYVGNFGQGARTIRSYRGHTIRVRGLIQRHDTFGPQIIVNSEDMIEVLD